MTWMVVEREEFSVAECEGIVGRHGGYKRLKSYQVARVIYDVTVRFCERYVGRGSRTCDQMTQAARSGAQNIAEGSMASGTSRKTELKLTGVARSSLEELRLDYKDFLRQRGLWEWPGDDGICGGRRKSDWSDWSDESEEWEIGTGS